MKTHAWDDSQNEGKLGAAVLDKTLAREFIVVPATEIHDRKQGADRFLIKLDDGRVIMTTDYKTDRAAGRYKNLALEDISVEWPEGNIVERGWIHTSIASHFIVYIPRFDNALLLNASVIRARWKEITEHSERKACQTTRGSSQWISRFYCAPLSWLRREGFFERHWLCLGIQEHLKFPGEDRR